MLPVKKTQVGLVPPWRYTRRRTSNSSSVLGDFSDDQLVGKAVTHVVVESKGPGSPVNCQTTNRLIISGDSGSSGNVATLESRSSISPGVQSFFKSHRSGSRNINIVEEDEGHVLDSERLVHGSSDQGPVHNDQSPSIDLEADGIRSPVRLSSGHVLSKEDARSSDLQTLSVECRLSLTYDKNRTSEAVRETKVFFKESKCIFVIL